MTPSKEFEQDFRNSVSAFFYEYRLRDCPTGWTRTCACDCEDPTRFAPSNDYDFLFYAYGNLYTLELKSTKGTSFALSLVTAKEGRPNHQIRGLLRSGKHDGVVSGFVINFRKYNRTFFIPIDIFYDVFLHSEVRSINLKRAQQLGVEIHQEQKIRRWRYDILRFVRETGVFYIPDE